MVMAGLLAALAVPAFAQAQVCVGSPAGPGQLSTRGEFIMPTPSGTVDLDVIASGQLPQRVWLEGGWGYRMRGRADNDAHRLHGGFGYSIPVGSGYSICPFARITYEADDLFTESESSFPVRRRTHWRIGAGAGKRYPMGSNATLAPFVSIAHGYHKGFGVTGWTSSGSLAAGVVVASRPWFARAQSRFAGGGDAAGVDLRLGVGVYF